MISKSVRNRFHTVYWDPPKTHIGEPTIFIPNHHGWFDGYLMYLALKRLQMVTMDWIEEYDAFPLFGKIGGMPFPKDDARRRAMTIRRSITKMEEDGTNLLLFAEGRLHYGPEVLPFPDGFDRLVQRFRAKSVTPVAIVYEHSLHERPEAFLRFGSPVPLDIASSESIHSTIVKLLDSLGKDVINGKTFDLLHRGTKDVNERWDMRRLPGK